MRQTWFIVDGNNLVHRDAHAAGVERAASMSYARLELLKRKYPLAIFAACWDSGHCFRRQLIEGYKAGRSKLDGIDDAIALTKRFFSDLAIPSFAVEGFEADDVIATLTAKARADGGHVVIYSADKDLHQLIESGHVLQMLMASKSHDAIIETWLNQLQFVKQYKVQPYQWVDYRCLLGDSSDTVKGVDGIGKVNAVKLLTRFPSLKDFMKVAGDDHWKSPLSTGLTNKVLAAGERIELLQKVFTLRTDVPLPEWWMEAV